MQVQIPMTPEQFATILGALATLIGAVAVLVQSTRRTHALINSRMTELLELTKKSALMEGALVEIKEAAQKPGNG